MSRKTRKRNPLKGCGPLQLAILAACGYIAVVNIEPWTHLIAPVFTSTDAAVIGMFYRIPVIGNLLQGGGWLVAIGASLIPWGLVQTFECLPTIMESSRRNLKTAIEGIQRNAQELNIDPSSDPRLQKLVTQYNNLPVQTLKGFYVGRMIAYAIDAVVVLWYYPILKGGWAALQYGVPLPQDWDVPNILRCLAILFLFQKLVELLLWSKNVREYLVVQEAQS